MGENVHDGSVLVVKTHTSDYQWKDARLEERNRDDALYGSAIFLIRNPLDAIITERHRLRISARPISKKVDISHIGKVDSTEFGK